jgi:predicted AAA+ superfamily ATPase
LSKLESAFILNRCSRYDITDKEILKTQQKFYLSDPAFRYSVLGYTPDSVAAMLENLICLELLRRGYEVSIGKIETAEIDFVAVKQEKKLYIQVMQQIDRKETGGKESMIDFLTFIIITRNMYHGQMNSRAETFSGLRQCMLRISC